jgi:hypothetical protein
VFRNRARDDGARGPALLDSTVRQLSHQPTLETRHRKQMQPGKEAFVAPWELRVGDLRLYYETHETPQRLVVVVAVGVKVRNRLRVAGREYGHENG